MSPVIKLRDIAWIEWQSSGLTRMHQQKSRDWSACSNQILIKINKFHLPLLQFLDHPALLRRFHVPPIPDFIQRPLAALTQTGGFTHCANAYTWRLNDIFMTVSQTHAIPIIRYGKNTQGLQESPHLIARINQKYTRRILSTAIRHQARKI